MCGIAGWIGKSKNPRLDIFNLAIPLIARGQDAGGIGVFYKETQTIWKKPGPITNLFKDFQYNELVEQAGEADVVFIHTRLATHGSPSNNNNNHPIFGSRYFLIHNGIVMPTVERPAKGETDSEQLLRAIEEVGLREGIKGTPGSKAIALYDKEEDICILYRNYNMPLYIVDVEEALYFSSQSFSLKNMFPGEKVKFLDPFVLYTIEHD